MAAYSKSCLKKTILCLARVIYMMMVDYLYLQFWCDDYYTTVCAVIFEMIWNFKVQSECKFTLDNVYRTDGKLWSTETRWRMLKIQVPGEVSRTCANMTTGFKYSNSAMLSHCIHFLGTCRNRKIAITGQNTSPHLPMSIYTLILYIII